MALVALEKTYHVGNKLARVDKLASPTRYPPLGARHHRILLLFLGTDCTGKDHVCD